MPPRLSSRWTTPATAVYKGLALVTTPRCNCIAANFKSGGIDVFDAQFKPVTLAAGSFVDPKVPAGFAPFNIWNIGGKLYVAYAKQDANKKFDVAGAGNGYVSVFDSTGKLLQSLVAGGTGSLLNSPWGLALAPATFGKFANDLLVGNFGDGLINAYDPTTGAFVGTLQDANGKNIALPGLWSLYFGNGGSGGDKDTLYFTAGPGGQKHGILGSISANPNVAARADHQRRASHGRHRAQHLHHHQGNQPGGHQAVSGRRRISVLRARRCPPRSMA